MLPSHSEVEPVNESWIGGDYLPVRIRHTCVADVAEIFRRSYHNLKQTYNRITEPD